MRFLFWLVALPLLFIAAFFAISNREIVTVDLWPFAGTVSVPLYFALVGALFVGFGFGALVAWWGGRHARGRARAEGHRAERLQQEVDRLQARLDAAQPRPAAAALPMAPPPRETAGPWPAR
jgi:hypothetical protein